MSIDQLSAAADRAGTGRRKYLVLLVGLGLLACLAVGAVLLFATAAGAAGGCGGP